MASHRLVRSIRCRLRVTACTSTACCQALAATHFVASDGRPVLSLLTRPLSPSPSPLSLSLPPPPPPSTIYPNEFPGAMHCSPRCHTLAKQLHDPSRPFKCDFCSCRFTSIATRTTHMARQCLSRPAATTRHKTESSPDKRTAMAGAAAISSSHAHATESMAKKVASPRPTSSDKRAVNVRAAAVVSSHAPAAAKSYVCDKCGFRCERSSQLERHSKVRV